MRRDVRFLTSKLGESLRRAAGPGRTFNTIRLDTDEVYRKVFDRPMLVEDEPDTVQPPAKKARSQPVLARLRRIAAQRSVLLAAIAIALLWAIPVQIMALASPGLADGSLTTGLDGRASLSGGPDTAGGGRKREDAAGSQASGTPTSVAGAAVKATLTRTVTPTRTSTPLPTLTSTPSPTPEPTFTPTPLPTDTPQPTLTPTVAPQPPTRTPVRQVRYQVRSGDNLTTIAARYGTTIDAIKRANGLGSSVIYAGQVLVIPVRR
jgi:LysM repeat protein